MKKFAMCLIVLSMISVNITQAQDLMASAEAVVTLKMKAYNGSNAAAVCYNDDKNLYYAAFAGNEKYSLEVFDLYGQHLFQTKTNFDVRGLWYNPKTKQIEGNAYNNEGIIRKKLDEKAYPFEEASPVLAVTEGPTQQAVGIYNSRKKVIYYMGKVSEAEVEIYKAKDHSLKGKVKLQLPASASEINETTILYTGVKNMEFAVLDVGNSKLLFFDKKGNYKDSIPLHVSFELQTWFNVSFANGYLFLFNKNDREWTGYKVFR
jgi:hypothetical protein